MLWSKAHIINDLRRASKRMSMRAHACSPGIAGSMEITSHAASLVARMSAGLRYSAITLTLRGQEDGNARNFALFEADGNDVDRDRSALLRPDRAGDRCYSLEVLCVLELCSLGCSL